MQKSIINLRKIFLRFNTFTTNPINGLYKCVMSSIDAVKPVRAKRTARHIRSPHNNAVCARQLIPVGVLLASGAAWRAVHRKQRAT